MELKTVSLEVKHEGWYHPDELNAFAENLGLKLSHWYSKDEYTLILVCTK